MEYRNLGNSGLKVSSLCFGAMTFGEADEHSFMHKVGADEATAHAMLDQAVEAGINFVDTADGYTGGASVETPRPTKDTAHRAEALLLWADFGSVN